MRPPSIQTPISHDQVLVFLVGSALWALIENKPISPLQCICPFPYLHTHMHTSLTWLGEGAGAVLITKNIRPIPSLLIVIEMREVWKCVSSKIERVGWMCCPPRLSIAIKRRRRLCGLQIGLAEQILSEWRNACTIIKRSKFIKTHTGMWSRCLQSGPHRHLKWSWCLSWRLKVKSDSHSHVILSYFIVVLVPFRALQCIFMPPSAFVSELPTIFQDNCKRLIGLHRKKKNITSWPLLMTLAFIPEAHVYQTPRSGGLFVFAMLPFYWEHHWCRFSALQPMKQEHQA